MDDKVIVTNRGALIKKYGGAGLSMIRKALTTLVAADKKRGIKTRVIYLDNHNSMKKLGGEAVTSAVDPRQNKQAIDAVFRSLKPAYLMILGAPDVTPHQDLKSPAYDPPDDDDRWAWSDLPYACDAPYSQDPARFVGPTRVVGRLPDLVGASEPSYLLSLLKTAAGYRSRSQDDYTRYFGLSAAVWKGSTRISLDNIFGNADGLLLAPPAGPNYPNGQLHARMHFINCHGGVASPVFQGQKGKSYPQSLTTKATMGQIVEGAVAAVECCYGAELYDSVTLALDIPICQSYLHQGAYGYLGSTTIAYGGTDDNGSADLICQYFLLNVLDGASIGRAALQARQQFIANTGQMDPFDLKTLAQFCLLGDPSVHPVTPPVSSNIPKSTSVADAKRFFRAERRAKLYQTGEFLAATKPTASKRARKYQASKNTAKALANIAALAGLARSQRYETFAVEHATASRSNATKAATAPSFYHIAVSTPQGKASPKVRRGVAVVAKELNGRIVGYRIYHQR